MSKRLLSGLLICAAVAALAQDGAAPTTAPGYSSPRVDVGLVVADFGRSKAFYEGALGLKEAGGFTAPADLGAAVGLSDGKPFTVHVLQAGDGPAATQVKLLEFDGTRPRRPDNSFLHSSYGLRYLTLYVDDLNAALGRAAEAGVKPIGQGAQALPATIASGVGIAVVRDPDGNFVELVGPYGG